MGPNVEALANNLMWVIFSAIASAIFSATTLITLVRLIFKMGKVFQEFKDLQQMVGCLDRRVARLEDRMGCRYEPPEPEAG